MEQLIPFDTSKGGSTPNLCLANVVAGYGIENKYDSAWEAWENTQQHTDPVPDGLDVPLFYSYTTTIDGVTQNYGHINVRLANGTVWSDGNIYDSIDGYLANHTPKFVGWGESVNDFKIIGEDMGQIADLQAQVTSLQNELTGERAGYTSLQNDYTSEKNRADGLQTELTAERATYEKWIAELQAQLAAKPTVGSTLNSATPIVTTSTNPAQPTKSSQPSAPESWYTKLINYFKKG